jgi:Tfp pilus assembly protein PilV
MRARFSDAGGYTLVEVLVAAMILVVGVLGVFLLLDGANAQSVANRTRVGGSNLARELTEDARSLDYDKLTPGALPAALAAFPNVGGSGSPLTVMRRGTTYTVQVSVCSFDDPKDGQSLTPPVNACDPAPTSVSSSDSNPDDYRRVKLTITWDRGPGARRLEQTALITNPSGGLGPRITQFDGPAGQVTGNVTTVNFPTTTTAGTAAVHWSSDGLNGSGDATGGPTTWGINWSLGNPATPLAILTSNAPPSQYDPATTVLDGVYTATAQAFDDRSIAGDSRVAVLSLNRSLPLTVSGVHGAFNGDVTNPSVYVTWTQNPEHDIVGYHVYRSPDAVLGDANDQLLDCQGTTLPTGVVCADNDPYQGGSLPRIVYYYVKAVDLSDIRFSTSTQRESEYPKTLAPGGLQTVLLPDRNLPPIGSKPAPPQGVQLDTAAFRSPTLTWTHPDLANIDYFWIYRDGCAQGKRYEQTAGNATSWLDTAPGSGHTYYVTAVSKVNGYESACSNGVTWP